jgi:hypothetical protein
MDRADRRHDLTASMHLTLPPAGRS